MGGGNLRNMDSILPSLYMVQWVVLTKTIINLLIP